MRHETNNVRSHPRGDPISTTFYNPFIPIPNPFIPIIKSHLIKQLNCQCLMSGLIRLRPKQRFTVPIINLGPERLLCLDLIQSLNENILETFIKALKIIFVKYLS